MLPSKQVVNLFLVASDEVFVVDVWWSGGGVVGIVDPGVFNFVSKWSLSSYFASIGSWSSCVHSIFFISEKL